jgi:hypothetical protein
MGPPGPDLEGKECVVKKLKRVRVGRKIEPGRPRTKREARAHVDVIRCALEAAAIQLEQLGLPQIAAPVQEIATKLRLLKKLARPE